MTGSGVMTIFVYKGLTRNPKIRNTCPLVLPNIWKLGPVRDTRFCKKASNKMLVGARVTAFTVSELFKEITEYTSLFLIL